MTFAITSSSDPEEIIPIIRLLRDQMPETLLKKRVENALFNGTTFKLASFNDKVCACLSYRITHDVYWGKTLFVDDLVVDPNLRGQEIGTKFLSAIKAEASARSCDHIRLCSGLLRSDAHRFYEANGFLKSSIQFAHPLT